MLHLFSLSAVFVSLASFAVVINCESFVHTAGNRHFDERGWLAQIEFPRKKKFAIALIPMNGRTNKQIVPPSACGGVKSKVALLEAIIFTHRWIISRCLAVQQKCTGTDQLFDGIPIRGRFVQRHYIIRGAERQRYRGKRSENFFNLQSVERMQCGPKLHPTPSSFTWLVLMRLIAFHLCNKYFTCMK